MKTTKIDQKYSRLATLLEIASRKGFDHAFFDSNALGRPYSVGFVDADGDRHSVYVSPDDDLWPFLTGKRYR